MTDQTPSSQKPRFATILGNWLEQNPTTFVALGGLLVYAMCGTAHLYFYGQFGLSLSDVGLSYGAILSRSALALLVTVSGLIIGAVALTIWQLLLVGLYSARDDGQGWTAWLLIAAVVVWIVLGITGGQWGSGLIVPAFAAVLQAAVAAVRLSREGVVPSPFDVSLAIVTVSSYWLSAAVVAVILLRSIGQPASAVSVILGVGVAVPYAVVTALVPIAYGHWRRSGRAACSGGATAFEDDLESTRTSFHSWWRSRWLSTADRLFSSFPDRLVIGIALVGLIFLITGVLVATVSYFDATGLRNGATSRAGLLGHAAHSSVTCVRVETFEGEPLSAVPGYAIYLGTSANGSVALYDPESDRTIRMPESELVITTVRPGDCRVGS